MKQVSVRAGFALALLSGALLLSVSCSSGKSSGNSNAAGSNAGGADSGGAGGLSLGLGGSSGSLVAGGASNCGDTQTDPNNCGKCGNACGAGLGCVAGACTCPSYSSLCDGACIPTSTDPKNCGACGKACTGKQACSAGVCSDSCLPGLSACDNSCVDLQNDSAHCGDCATACPDKQGCANGRCVDTVTVGADPKTCAGGGDPISVGSGPQHCLGTLAQTTFRWSVCSCTDLNVSAKLTTDAYDSTTGPYQPGQLGGGVGVNRDVSNWSEAVDVGGTLWVSGSKGYSSSGPASDVKADLHLGGSWKASTPFSVAGAAYVVGSLSGVTVKGKTSTVTSVDPACDCNASQLVPVVDIVQAHRSPNNDNAAISLDEKVFEKPGTPLRLDLPCGNFYFTSIAPSLALTIHVHGRTAIYVEGDVSASSPLAFTLEPDAELDVFIGGTLKTSDTFVFGSPNYPALSRIYVGGTAKIALSSDVRLAGEFYAANSEQVVWSAKNAIYGAVFAGNFRSSDVTDIHYDRGVLRAGDKCPPGGGGSGGGGGSECGSCQDCHNQACKDGMCGSCTTDSDCCAPLVCDSGTCVPEVVVK